MITYYYRKTIPELLFAVVAIIACVYFVFSLYSQKETEKAVVQATNDKTGVLVLNYHKVENKLMSLAITLDDFERQMKTLKEKGYVSITPDQLYEYISNGTPLPQNPVLITFDDGYKDNYKNAYPIMKEYGFTGTIFVVTSFLGNYDNYMTWDQAKELAANGFCIESHTATHQSLTELNDEQVRKELDQSKADIKEKLGKEANYFAYPTGTYNLHLAQLVRDAGYKGAFTIKYDVVSRDTNLYAIERVPIFHTETTTKDFLQRIDYLPLYEKYGWKKN